MLICATSYFCHDWPWLHGLVADGLCVCFCQGYGPTPWLGALALVICATVSATCVCACLNVVWVVDAPVL